MPVIPRPCPPRDVSPPPHRLMRDISPPKALSPFRAEERGSLYNGLGEGYGMGMREHTDRFVQQRHELDNYLTSLDRRGGATIDHQVGYARNQVGSQGGYQFKSSYGRELLKNDRRPYC